MATFTYKTWPPGLDITGTNNQELADLSGCRDEAKKWAVENGCDPDQISAFVDTGPGGKTLAFRFLVATPPLHPLVAAERERCARVAEDTRGWGDASADIAAKIRSGE